MPGMISHPNFTHVTPLRSLQFPDHVDAVMVQERNVLAAFLQNVRVAAMDADHMMDVGAIDHFLFPGGPVVGLHPQVVAVCPGALTANGLIRKEAVIGQSALWA